MLTESFINFFSLWLPVTNLEAYVDVHQFLLEGLGSAKSHGLVSIYEGEAERLRNVELR